MNKLQINAAVTIDHGDDWTEFKKWLNGTYAHKHHTWVEDSSAYQICFQDGNMVHLVGINKDSGANQQDFEANWKTVQENVSVKDGEQVVASAYSAIKEAGRFQGLLIQASGIDTDTMLDHRIDRQIYVHGGWFWSEGGSCGDYAEFSVVDKDDVLGYFQYYGLTSGVDVLELGKYVKTQYLRPAGIDMCHLETPTVAPVCPGLYMRTKIHTTSETPVCLGVTYLWFEV
jgi:hypothetical protein